MSAATERMNVAGIDDDERVAHAGNRNILCLYGWDRSLHNPRLPRGLGCIDVPTLVLWDAGDGTVSATCGRAHAGQMPGAEYQIVEAVDRQPDIEQPDATARAVNDFLSG
jgi:pimeloyl-ACP methyl ester carboxylesterase